MKKVLLFTFLVLSFSSVSLAESWNELYPKADYVAHIRIVESPASSGFTHDLGTTWYEVKFFAEEVHKNRDSINLSSFWFVHYGYDTPDSSLFVAGSEWIVFLSRSGLSDPLDPSKKIEPRDFREPALMKDGKMPFNPQINKEIRQLRYATSFDRAVSAGDFEMVEELIISKVQASSFHHGEKLYAAIREITNWLRSFSTVDAAEGDTCATHICIYPGWYDLGIRFLTEKEPQEYKLTLSLGKEVHLGWLRYIYRKSRSVERVFFKSFRKAPGVLDQIYHTCVQYQFQRKQSWIRQDDVEISVESLQDTIWIVPGQMTFLQVKVKIINKSPEAKMILWPRQQDWGYQQFRMRLHDEEGNILEEEELFPLVPGDPRTDVSLVELLPGDSLVGYHTINDFYAPFSDMSANHFFPFLRETRYLISLVYSPMRDGDTSLYWAPAGGSREVFYHIPIPALFQQEAPEEETVTLRLIEKEGFYTNKNGKKGSYDGWAEVIGAPEGSMLLPGERVAFRFPFTMYERGIAESRPATDLDLMEPGDLIQADINLAYPPDLLIPEQDRPIRIVLLANRGDALRIVH